jgi:DNA-binding GntR family transcriptional regulator
LSQPLYVTIADDIRERIIDGHLKPGDVLPSELAASAERGVSRSVVRQAYQQLEAEGLVLSGQGRGWYVREHQPLIWYASRPERNTRTDISPADAWSTGVREQGRTPTEQIELAVLDAPRRIAAALNLIPEEPVVVVRRRRRYVDGVLYALADTYYPEKAVRNTPIARPGDVLPGTYAVMAELGMGWDDTRSVDDIEPVNASREIADLFGVPIGNAMTEHFRIRYTPAGQPVAVTITTSPRGRVIVRYEGKSWLHTP